MASSTLVTCGIIAAWYGSNIGVLLLNKYLLSIYGFKYPVFLTLCHMLACSAMSYAVAASRMVTLSPVKSRKQFYKISALAVVFCITVVLGNVSLRFIPVSFNQAIGATTPAFTALLAAVVLAQRESREVYLSLIPVVVGIVIASGAEPMFNLIGFVAAVTATGARAFKSVLQGFMLSDSNEKLDSLSLLMYMAPVATAALIPAAVYFEPDALAVAMELGADGTFWGLLFLNSFLAYFVNLTNFLVTKHTSALTLQVLGNAKGVVAVVMSVLYFRNPVNVYSVLGYCITVTGVVLYSQAKNRSLAQKHLLLASEGKQRQSGELGKQPLLPAKKMATKRELLQQMGKGGDELPRQQKTAAGGGGGGEESEGLLKASGGGVDTKIAAHLAGGGGHGSSFAIPAGSRLPDKAPIMGMVRGYSAMYEV